MSKRTHSYTCPLCHHHTINDTEFVMYKSPDNIPDTCCINCFDDILIAYNKTIENLKNKGRFIAKLNREKKILEKEQALINNFSNKLVCS